MKHVKPSSFTLSKHINVDLAKELITVIEKFKHEILIFTKHKTKDPHEK
jgi:hypothetical protein